MEQHIPAVRKVMTQCLYEGLSVNSAWIAPYIPGQYRLIMSVNENNKADSLHRWVSRIIFQQLSEIDAAAIGELSFNFSFPAEDWIEVTLPPDVLEAYTTPKLFDMDRVLKLQEKNRIEVVLTEDLQYLCLINGKSYASGITPMYALAYGTYLYNKMDNRP